MRRRVESEIEFTNFHFRESRDATPVARSIVPCDLSRPSPQQRFYRKL